MSGWRRVGGLVALALSTVVLWFGGSTVYLSYARERDYLLGRFVLELVEEYAKEHGRWPGSWSDLERMKRPDWGDWPGDSTTVKQLIFVDFDARIGELAQQDLDQFRAVHPIRPNELFDDADFRKAHVGPLLETVRRLDRQHAGRE